MHIREYEAELGTPWKNLDAYLRNAYPLLHADRIKTPTLFLCGDRDFNVPLLNSEQMYQALRSLGVDTQLVIYPRAILWPAEAELPARPDAAVSRLVRQIPEAVIAAGHAFGAVSERLCEVAELQPDVSPACGCQREGYTDRRSQGVSALARTGRPYTRARSASERS
jgi:Prolyl oligopeptidase family